MSKTIFLVRHAMPQQPYNGRYDVVPGPNLSSFGRDQAEQTGQFLADKGITRLFHSPLMRTIETAAILAGYVRALSQQADDLAEWQHGESGQTVRQRVADFWSSVVDDNGRDRVVALITHGGVIDQLLRHLSEDQIDLSSHNYWGRTTTPPGGVWQVTQSPENGTWELDLIFDPGEKASQQSTVKS